MSSALSCSFPIDLPTSVVTPLPIGAPVNIGGPEAVDYMVAAAAGVKAGLKAGFRYAKGKWGKQLSKWARNRFKIPAGSKRSKIVCFLTGHPVDVVSGELIADAVDFDLGGSVMPMSWERNYRSREGRHPTLPTMSTSMTERTPALGPAWFHPFESWIEEEENGAVVHVRGTDGRPKTFEGLVASGDAQWDPEDRETLVRTPQGYDLVLEDGRRWIYRVLDGAAPRGGARRVLLPTAIVDACHNRIEFHYERGYLRYVIDAAGRVLDVRRTAQHRLESVWFIGFVDARRGDPSIPNAEPLRGLNLLTTAQRLVAYRYEAGQLTEAIDAEDRRMSYAWSGGVIVEEVHSGGMTFRFAWDFDHPDGDCIRTWGERPDFDPSPGAHNPMPRILYDRRIRYQKERRLTTVEDGRGGITRYFTNALGLVDKVVDPLGATTEYEYRPETWKTAERDGLGNETKWEHDAQGHVVRETNALGQSTTWAYDAAGNVTEMVNAAGGRVNVAWDYRRRPISVTNPVGDVTLYAHDELGRTLWVKDPMGHTTRLAWNARHDLITIRDAEGRETQRACDDFGRVVWSKDPIARELRVQRNRVGEPMYVERPDGERLTLRRDEDGNVVEQTDSLGRRVRMRYAGLGSLVEHTDAMGYRVRLQYDSDEELIAVENQAGDQYRFELDVAGRVKTERTFSGTRRQYLYDKAGRTKQYATGAHRVVKFERDAVGRVVTQRTTSPVLGGAPTEETFAFDALGDLIAATTPSGAVELSRDSLGRIVREGTRIEETATEAAIASSFDRSGLRTERSTSLAHRTSYRYNAMGDLIGVGAGWDLGQAQPLLKKRGLPQATEPDFEIALARDAVGNELARRMPGGVATRWSRDQFGRPIEQRILTGATSQSPGRDIARKGYAWNAPDQIASIFDLDAQGHAKGGSRYEHDPRGYLIRQILSDGTEVHRAADPVGNLFRSREMTDRVYGKGGVLKKIGSTEVEHDADGNLTKKVLSDGATWRYQWDAHGRLARVERPDGQNVAFTYDAFGRRLTKAFGGKTTEYIWDGDDLVHERVRAEGGAVATPMTTWVFEPGRFAPLAKIEGRKRYGVVTDHLGTPNVLTTEAGKIAWKAQLDVYGVVREETGGVEGGEGGEAGERTANPWRYPGQYEDAETGLYYNRFRYYDPELGRYVSEDPIGLEGGIGLYGYVRGPLGWLDPLGLTGTCAAEGLPQMKGSSVSKAERVLSEHGFVRTRISNSAGRNQVWRHSDGSEVRIHPYGNQSASPFRSGNNAHIHKQDPGARQLTDRGAPSADPAETHIGIRNPSDLPQVRGREHGAGTI